MVPSAWSGDAVGVVLAGEEPALGSKGQAVALVAWFATDSACRGNSCVDAVALQVGVEPVAGVNQTDHR
jgi:hypothetical protein